MLKVRDRPARVDHRFADRLDHKLLDATGVAGTGTLTDRPGTDQRLIQQRFLVSLGSSDTFYTTAFGLVPFAPDVQAPLPFFGDFGKHIDASSHVLRSFCVMRHG